MSDPMTNREIEDVLSSIRRLVSQDGARPDPASGPDADAAQVSRLVLTEAHRVAPPAAPAAPPSATNHDPIALEVTLSELEAAISAADARLEPLDPDLSSADGATGADADQTDVAVAGSDHDSDPDHRGATPSNVTALYGRISFVHREGADHRPDPANGAARPAEAAAGAEIPAGSGPATEAGTEMATEIEPESGSGAMAWQTPPADAAGAPETGPANPVPGARAPDHADDGAGVSAADWTGEAGPDYAEAVIDEDMLRALVAQLVREELRGQLGERITHQVRKLVRAEIARVLDERNLI